jgi:hypothetical protein
MAVAAQRAPTAEAVAAAPLVVFSRAALPRRRAIVAGTVSAVAVDLAAEKDSAAAVVVEDSGAVAVAEDSEEAADDVVAGAAAGADDWGRR